MDIPVVEDTVVDVQRLGVGLHIFEGEDGRLLHHVTQVSRQRELVALALRQRSLDKQYLSAHARPGQTCHHTGIVVALIDVAIEGGLAQQILYLGRRNLLIVGILLHLTLIGYLAEGLVDLFLQLAHAALTGVPFNNHLDGSLVEGRLQTPASCLLTPDSSLQSRILQLTGNQVTLGDFYFFFGDIAAHLNDLHTVE